MIRHIIKLSISHNIFPVIFQNSNQQRFGPQSGQKENQLPAKTRTFEETPENVRKIKKKGPQTYISI